jgi:catechol 2,3-dioxygenase-like lactoylglutathione lyase family enzyme
MEVGLCCADLDTLAAFYVDVLAFTQVNVIEVPTEKAVGTALTNAAYRVTRLQSPWGERIKLLEPAGGAKPGVGKTPFILDVLNTAYITFIVDDLKALLAHLLDKGVAKGMEILTGDEVIEVRPGVLLVFARDPEGNVLEFVQYVDLAAYRDDLPRPVGA